MAKSGRPQTLKDLAELCGVSRQAVSAALGLSRSNNTRLSKEKAEYINKIAREHNFRPHRAARKLQSRRHDCYGVLVHNVFNISMPTLVELLEEARNRKKLLIMDNFTLENPTSRFVSEDCVDGIISFSDTPEELLNRIRDIKLPILHVNTSNTEKVDHIIKYDDPQSITLSINYLKEHKRKNIALFHHRMDHYSVNERINTFLEQKDDIKPEHLLVHDEYVSDKEVADFFTKYPEVDAVIVSSVHAIVATYRVLAEMNKSIPEDISVIGFIWPGLELPVKPSITGPVISQPELAKTIFANMENLVNGNKVKSPVKMQYFMNEGSSVAPE